MLSKIVKTAFAVIVCVAAFSFADDDDLDKVIDKMFNNIILCDVVDKGVIRCTQDDEYTRGAYRIIYRIEKDGSWIRKSMKLPPDSDKWYTMEVVVKKMSNFVNFPCIKEGLFGEYMFSKGNCNTSSKYFIDMIKKGKSFSIMDFSGTNYFDLMGEYETVGKVVCSSQNNITTYNGVSRITGLYTDMNEYFKIQPGTYCEDFLGSEALYWKP